MLHHGARLLLGRLYAQQGDTARARATFEKRQLRHALEAERMLSGQWPASLDPGELEGTAVGALTPDNADEYYYARRGNGIILLAPEQ